jgi:hypothetical protein
VYEKDSDESGSHSALTHEVPNTAVHALGGDQVEDWVETKVQFSDRGQ